MPWLSGYTIRKSKVVENLPGSVPNYQIKLTLYKYGTGPDSYTEIYLGGNVLDNFIDIRFTGPDQITLLDYWLESYVSGNYAIIWIKIPTNINPNKIYIYYDNPLETISLSNESNIWTTYSYSSQFSNTQGGNGWYYYQRNRGSSPGTGWTPMNWDAVSYGGFWRGVGAWPLGLWSGQQHPYRSIDAVILWQNNTNLYLRITGYAQRGDCGGNGVNNRIIKRNISTQSESTLWSYTFSGCEVGTQNLNIEAAKMSNESIDFYIDSLGDDGYDTSRFIPTIKTRPYVSPEPTFGVSGVEELNITAIEPFTLSQNTCTGQCSISVGITWRNYGNNSLTFRPAIIINDVTIAYGSTDITILANDIGYGLITTPILSTGINTICPYPN